MGGFNDLTGKKFGKWTAIRFESIKGRSHWWCECECGDIVRVQTYNLTSEKSVGCRNCYAPADITTGDKFSDWTVISQTDYTTDKVFLCQCKCGNISEVLASDLRQGKSTKCKQCRKTHGMTNTRFYRVWVNMRQRCENPKSRAFHNYGKRGIKVCEEWQDFQKFKDDMFTGYEEHKRDHSEYQNTTLERSNNDKGYSKSNCKWATAKEQGNNTRTVVKFTAISPSGVKQEVIGINRFCREKNLSRGNVRRCLKEPHRHCKGWKFKKI